MNEGRDHVELTSVFLHIKIEARPSPDLQRILSDRTRQHNSTDGYGSEEPLAFFIILERRTKIACIRKRIKSVRNGGKELFYGTEHRSQSF